jgi:hypothetical protein
MDFDEDDPADEDSNAHCLLAVTNIARIGGVGDEFESILA